MGRKDLIRAAWVNSAPHHGYGRAMKVSKEEIVGMVTAIESFTSTRDLKAEYKVWDSWYNLIAAELSKIDGIKTKLIPPAGASPFPVLQLSWDPTKIPINGEQVHKLLLEGNPRIMSHAEGESTSFVIRAVTMRPEHPPIVARRLSEVFRSASGIPVPAPSSVDLAGVWEVDLNFANGKTRHVLTFDSKGKAGRLRGLHIGKSARNRFNAILDGDKLTIQSQLRLEGMQVHYRFAGTVSGDSYSGDLSLGEFGNGTFTARRT
jgi:L-seryl-tRNA(Ser) seleniumtransferase